MLFGIDVDKSPIPILLYEKYKIKKLYSENVGGGTRRVTQTNSVDED